MPPKVSARRSPRVSGGKTLKKPAAARPKSAATLKLAAAKKPPARAKPGKAAPAERRIKKEAVQAGRPKMTSKMQDGKPGWSKKEIAQLVGLVQAEGLGNWQAKADTLGTGRSGAACSSCWYRSNEANEEEQQQEEQEAKQPKTKRARTAVQPAASNGRGKLAAPTAKRKRAAAQQPKRATRKQQQLQEVTRPGGPRAFQTNAPGPYCLTRVGLAMCSEQVDDDALRGGSASAIADARREDMTGHITATHVDNVSARQPPALATARRRRFDAGISAATL